MTAETCEYVITGDGPQGPVFGRCRKPAGHEKGEVVVSHEARMELVDEVSGNSAVYDVAAAHPRVPTGLDLAACRATVKQVEDRRNGGAR